MNNINCKFVEVLFSQGQQFDKDFKKINPNAKVPALTDVLNYREGNEKVVVLYESHTMLRYLHETRYCADHWYPKDLRKRAQIDAYLDWHHGNMRIGSSKYIVEKFLSPLTGKPYSEEAV